MNTELTTCKTCGAAFTGNYCNNCGEKIYDDTDKSVKNLFDEIFHFFTHFDSKFFKTLRLVLTKPGYLSYHYCEGVRKPFFKPVSLFFICVILYLLFPLFRGLNMQFYSFANPAYRYNLIAEPIIKHKLQDHTLTLDTLAKHYNETSPKFAKVLLLLFLPLSAFALNGLFYRRKRYYFDHFILATELNTFFVSTGFLLLPILVLTILKIWPASEPFFTNDGGIFVVIVGCFYLVMFSIALRRFYKEKWGWTVLKSIVFFALYLFIIRFIYNIVLFLVVMLFVH